MNKIFCVLIAALMLFTLGCGGKTGPSGGDPASSPQSGATTAPDNSGELSKDIIPGTLYFGAFSVRYPELKALSLSGNRAGSTEFNSREPSTEGIRFIFELNEWVEYHLLCEGLEKELTVYLFPHRDLSLYKHLDPEEALYAETFEPGAEITGSFCVSPEEGEPGWYDLLFTVDGMFVVFTDIRMFEMESLSQLSDAELESMMK